VVAVRDSRRGTVWSDGQSWLARAIALLAPAIALVLFDRKIVRWLAPLPRAECIQCGYTFRGLAVMRCPECGWDATTDESPGGAPSPPSPSPRRDAPRG
jgi:hypothetical protein